MFAKPLIVIVLAFAVSAMATRLHVNSGCILADGHKLCAKNYRDMSRHAEIHAGFPGNSDRERDKVGCVKYFNWPANYGDVYFGKDNCLYDSKGQNIESQCCRNGGGFEMKNPYHRS